MKKEVSNEKRGLEGKKEVSNEKKRFRMKKRGL